MKARKLFSKKERLPDGSIVEMVMNRLYYGKQGKRLVGYDNEHGKGDHRHIGDQEFPCPFVSERHLIADFLADVKKMRGE